MASKWVQREGRTSRKVRSMRRSSLFSRKKAVNFSSSSIRTALAAKAPPCKRAGLDSACSSPFCESSKVLSERAGAPDRRTGQSGGGTFPLKRRSRKELRMTWRRRPSSPPTAGVSSSPKPSPIT